MMIDLLEASRRDDVYNDIQGVCDQIDGLTVFPSLVWVYTWSLIRDVFNDYEYATAVENGEYEAVPEGTTLKQIWDTFWETADETGWSLEYGPETISELVYDWMRDNNFLEELDEEDEDSVESEGEEE